jgi:hypothetical protein
MFQPSATTCGIVCDPDGLCKPRIALGDSAPCRAIPRLNIGVSRAGVVVGGLRIVMGLSDGPLLWVAYSPLASSFTNR